MEEIDIRRHCNTTNNLKMMHQSAMNKHPTVSSPRFRGVKKCGPNTWEATIHLSEKNTLYLGEYQSEEKAAMVYDEAARKHQGSYAIVNFEDDETEGSTTSPSYHSGSGSDEGDSTIGEISIVASTQHININHPHSKIQDKITQKTKVTERSNSNDSNKDEIAQGAVIDNQEKLNSGQRNRDDKSTKTKTQVALLSTLNIADNNIKAISGGANDDGFRKNNNSNSISDSSISNNNINNKNSNNNVSDGTMNELARYDINDIAGWIKEWSSKAQTEEQYRQLNAVVNSGNLNDLEKTKNALTEQTKRIKELIDKVERSNKATIKKHLEQGTIEYLRNSCYEEIKVVKEMKIDTKNNINRNNSNKKRKRSNDREGDSDNNTTPLNDEDGGTRKTENNMRKSEISKRGEEVEEVIIVLCPYKEHKCLFEPIVPSTDYPHGEWICDVCDKSFNKGKRWNCSKCEYDCCPSCGKNQNICVSSKEKRTRIQRVALNLAGEGNVSESSSSNKSKVKSTCNIKVREGTFDPSSIFKSSMETLVVGQTVEIEWVENEKSEWYSGRVASYNEKEDKHRIEYFNNEVEFVTLLSDRSNGVNWRVPPPKQIVAPKRNNSSSSRVAYQSMESLMHNNKKLRLTGLTQSQKKFLIKIKKRRELEKLKSSLPSPDSVMSNQQGSTGKRGRGRPKGALNKTTMAKYFQLLELQQRQTS